MSKLSETKDNKNSKIENKILFTYLPELDKAG